MDWSNPTWYAVLGFVILQSIIILFGFLKLNKTKDSTQMTKLTEIIAKSVQEQGKSIAKQSEATHELAIAVREICTFVENDSRYHSETLANLKISQNRFHQRLDTLQEITIKEILEKLNKIDIQTALCPSTKGGANENIS